MKKVEVVPNGVNTDVYKPSVDDRRRIRRMYGIGEEDPVLLFLGRCDYPPNRIAAEWIVRELAPRVTKERPDALIFIVGRDPPANLTSDKRIVFTGEVDDVASYINAGDICLAPITIGSGMRIKVLSYMACGKPVVSTPEGIEGIEVRDGEEILVRDLSHFTEGVFTALDQPSKMSELGSLGSKLVREKYDWKISAKKLNEIYQRL